MILEQWLNEKQGKVYRYKMEKIFYALELLGNPEKTFPIVHVAGTNGKGSTIAFLNELLQVHGWRVGTFVSPHLVSVHDRICINHQSIPDDEFQVLLRKIFQLEKKVEQRYEPFRYFEVMVLVMFLYFQKELPDIALIEVGIGGLLDTTNVVNPLLCLITSIGLDHQDLLGNRLEDIAEQKAGIIKQKTPVILGPVADELLPIFREKASHHQAPLYCEGNDFSLLDACFKNAEWTLDKIRLGLLGHHQEENAAVALQAFYLLMKEKADIINPPLVLTALWQTRWGGRLEKVGVLGNIYLDGAHNLPAIKRLMGFISSQKEKKVTVLFSALKRKDFQAMLAYMLTFLPETSLVLTSFSYDGGVRAEDVPEEVRYVEDYMDFIRDWENQSCEEEILVITGSLYFISEVRQLIGI